MYLPFHQLSDEARIWVYQASRPLAHAETAQLLQKAQEFLGQWAAHGHPLQCSAEIFYDQFLILAVEESYQSTTGCSIDASVQFIRELEQTFKVDLLDRTHVAFRYHDANFTVPLDQIQEKVKQGTITEDMLLFDNTITTKEALVGKWLVRAGDSWISMYFHKS